MSDERNAPPPNDLMTVGDIAQAFGIGESTVWLHAKRHQLARYRVPMHGKKTLFSRADIERVLRTPVPITPKKAAAA